MAAPFVYLPSTFHGNSPDALLKAALDGNLGRIKGIIRNLGIGNGDRAAVLSFHKDGFGVMHCAACQGHLEVCKYLVEELGCDPNMAEGSCEGATPFMASAQSGDISTVKYLLDHGGDLMKADAKGRTVLHHAVCGGSCKVTEFLLSKGIPVDIDCGCGTPLFHAANNEQDKTLKILLDHHANPNTIVGGGMGTPLMNALIYRSLKWKLLIKAGADVNGEGSVMPPLVFATGHRGYTNFIQLLLEAGANPNIPDDLGRLPIELAALRECKEEVEMLLPLTSPIPNVRNWSVDGVISHAKFENTKPLPNSPFTIPLNHFAALRIRKRRRRLHLRRIPSPMDPAAPGRFDRLQSSFKISVQCLLTACSREVVNEAFSLFTDAEKARLHRMLALVLKSMHANIMDEFNDFCEETQVAAALDKIDDFVEEQNLDALASEKTTVEEIQEKVSRAKKDEVEYLTGLLKKVQERANDSYDHQYFF